MLRFIITLVLINTSYHSLGSPTPPRTIVYPLGKSLHDLANLCKNPFLVSLINKYISECNINEFNIKQMQCLIFYDISNQLCGAVAHSKLVLQNNSINELNNVIDIDAMCKNAQNWKFSDLPGFLQYKANATTIFKNEYKCQKVCDVSDLSSEDSNIFCKYYEWGSEILKHQPSIAAALEKSTDKIIAALPDQPVNIDHKASGSFSNRITGVPTVKNEIIQLDNTLPKNYPVSITDTTLTNFEKPEEGPVDRVVQTSSLNTALSGGEINLDQQKDTNEKASELTPIEIAKNIAQSVVVQKPDVEEEQPPKKVDIEKEDQILNSQNKDIKDQVADDLGDDPDTEEDEKQDLADDSEISIGKGDNQKMEEKINENIESKNIPIKTTFTAEKSQEEFIAKIPQEDFPEDDDHFFSFFLTAVIIVVLLYILYHNKSKFTKVILGLIVEGRQPGRRRNSRGHAYRRLDTLEQAMSSNTPAPPSKIIY